MDIHAYGGGVKNLGVKNRTHEEIILHKIRATATTPEQSIGGCGIFLLGRRKDWLYAGIKDSRSHDRIRRYVTCTVCQKVDYHEGSFTQWVRVREMYILSHTGKEWRKDPRL
jgi:hypothetical protein